ncbi:MAG: penicillin-binding protein 2 [bacterium]|nr:penicillin-binding protein 2 [bacterium]
MQIINGEDYSKRADRQYVKPSSDILSRGSIFFLEKNGHAVSAATLKTVYIVAINPNILRDAEAAYSRIDEILKIDKEAFLMASARKDDPYEVITKLEDSDLADKIKGLGVPGLSVYKENVRFYPGGKLAAQILGIVARSKDEGDHYAGRYGLEKYYEDMLARNNESLRVNFFAEMFSNVKKTVVAGDKSASSGDIVLSIEPNVELYLDKELNALKDKWDPDSLGGIVIEPKTGRIVAATFLPDFDPNDFGKEKDISVFSNPMVENVFEFGSIIKPLTISAGIDAGVIKPETKYDDKGFVTLNGKKIENHDHKAMGRIDMQAVLDNSLNTGAVFVMQKLGRDKFRTYMESFGLGKKTGIDLPNETSGLTANLKSKYEIDYATSAFGQGIALTPVGAVRALSSLANGGVMVKPRIVDKIDSGLGAPKIFETVLQGRVLKEKTAREITGMLVHAFDKGLLGGVYKIKQYSIAAKTGTAQISDSSGKYGDKDLHSFFGYFPAYNPRFLVLLYMVDPKNGARFASDTLPIPFVNITKFLLNYYEVPPDR